MSTITASRVDRRSRVLRGVHVCGLKSKHGHDYTRAALQRALPLYEGAPVYFGHVPPGSRGKRPPGDRQLGTIRNVGLRPDGIYGDLHYLESHPLCASLLEAAERNPSLWCLSHNTYGYRTPDGDEVLGIQEVYSVDLVEHGGTTESLFGPLPRGKTTRRRPDVPGLPRTTEEFVARLLGGQRS